jgi:hypothetical protein
VICYLCAYFRPQLPHLAEPLPPGSDAAPDSTLANCHRCSVWVCSQHGTRYRVFQCAMCYPAQAVKYAFGVDEDEVAAALARLLSAVDVVVDFRLLQQITDPVARESLIATVLDNVRRSANVLQESPYGLPDNSPEAAAAAIRSAFTRDELRLRNDAADIVRGAIKMAYLLADPDYDGPIVQRPPWNVQYPRLIDPVIWLAYTAVVTELP